MHSRAANDPHPKRHVGSDLMRPGGHGVLGGIHIFLNDRAV